MAASKQVFRAAVVVLSAALALWNMNARAQALYDEPNSARIHIDNDLFSGRERDRDYTGGLAVIQTGAAARAGVTLDDALEMLDAPFNVLAAAPVVHHARQIGAMYFTPADILADAPLQTDRPYASLLFVANGRMYIDGGADAWFSSLTVGVLGLPLAGELHNAVHDVTGSDRPQGYEHQVSAGGEPTLRYVLARQHLWIAHPSNALDVKTTVQGSVGYLTEASAAISMRIGRFNSPWWSFTPELADYIAAPAPAEVGRARPGAPAGEFYFFAGARLKARAYNAFLQGQFRDSAVRYSYAEIEPVIGHVWLGFVTQLFERTQVSYALNYQTAELRDGVAARSALWGGVQLAHAF